jgi:hypothetical protein
MANCRLCKDFAIHRPETLPTSWLISLLISLSILLPIPLSISLPTPQELLLVPVS